MTERQEEKKLEVRLAETPEEIEKTLALRYNVFNAELGEGLPESADTQKDRDKYDDHCDHLIVIDRANNDMIVGTYRIIRTSVAREGIGFYSDNEFDLSYIYNLKDEVAELGRGCVHLDYRDGSVLPLLWAGLAWYVQKFKCRYMMGCGSVHSTDPALASQIYAYFKKKDWLTKEFQVPPTAEFTMEGFQEDAELINEKEVGLEVPSLIKGYVRAGAKVGSFPAVDKVFKTTDFFILFDSEKVEEKYGKRYRKTEEELKEMEKKLRND